MRRSQSQCNCNKLFLNWTFKIYWLQYWTTRKHAQNTNTDLSFRGTKMSLLCVWRSEYKQIDKDSERRRTRDGERAREKKRANKSVVIWLKWRGYYRRHSSATPCHSWQLIVYARRYLWQIYTIFALITIIWVWTCVFHLQ